MKPFVINNVNVKRGSAMCALRGKHLDAKLAGLRRCSDADDDGASVDSAWDVYRDRPSIIVKCSANDKCEHFCRQSHKLVSSIGDGSDAFVDMLVWLPIRRYGC